MSANRSSTTSCDHGRPIRYGYVTRDWPIENYRSVFSQDLGSAEMPSASRPFTAEVVADLVRHGVVFAPLVLHTGVSSAEFGEPPYPERYAVGRPTAALVNGARDAHNRVVAVGTTVVRALATVTDDRGVVHPGRGWTERFVTPDDPPTAVDGLVTGWHEPEATHLLMLEAVAGHDIVDRAYRAAVAERYLWHEFGDVHLLLREPGTAMNEQRVTISPAGTSMPDGRRRVLYALRRRGEATSDELARQLSMTRSGARQHLTALVDEGLVDAREIPSDPPRRGRPELSYAVTAIGDGAVPARLRRAHHRSARLPRRRGAPHARAPLRATARRAARADACRSPDGPSGRSVPRWRSSPRSWTRTATSPRGRTLDPAAAGGPQGYRIVENNCAIWAVAERFGQACTSEIDFIRAALGEGVSVERVHHMASGDSCCAYEIRPVDA